MKLGILFLGVYLLISVGFVAYALTCDFEFCGLLAFLPLTPWLQIFEGKLNVNLPFYSLPVWYFLNGAIIYLIGNGIQKLFLLRK